MMDEMQGKEGMACPPATQDITLNLKNRGRAIESAMYGPENPALPNTGFWREMAKEWDVPVEAAQMSRCGNCAAFDREPKMLQCIAQGMGEGSGDPWSAIKAGDLGYCEIFDFKCAASRTCRAWIAMDEGEGEEGEYEEGEDDSEEYGKPMMEGDDES